MRQLSLLSLLLIAFVLGIIWASPERAAACSCAYPADAVTELKNADAVFSGTVTAVTRPWIVRSSLQPVHATIAVDRFWKGSGRPAVTVATANATASCGFPFESGKQYLVFARGDSGTLTATICSRSKLLADAADDLAALGPGTAVQQQESVATRRAIIEALTVMLLGVGTIALARPQRTRHG